MKNVYFLNHDFNMHERQSDGVKFCIIPEFYDNKIYFYCDEYEMFWDSIKDVGDFDKCCNFKVNNTIRPANLEEICSEGLYSYIDSIQEYTIENNKVLNINRINLKN